MFPLPLVRPFSANEPMAMFLSPVTQCCRAMYPMATLRVPWMLSTKAFMPTATFQYPSVFDFIAFTPRAVLAIPNTDFSPLLTPMKMLVFCALPVTSCVVTPSLASATVIAGSCATSVIFLSDRPVTVPVYPARGVMDSFVPTAPATRANSYDTELPPPL